MLAGHRGAEPPESPVPRGVVADLMRELGLNPASDGPISAPRCTGSSPWSTQRDFTVAVPGQQLSGKITSWASQGVAA